jgi:hypothetical protein
MSIDVNIKGKNDDTLLHYACKNINQLSLDVFKVLIETHGVDVNIQNKERNTPIHLAFRCFDPNKGGDITVLTYLINQKNINPNINGKNGHTLLHLACIREIGYDSDDVKNSDEGLEDSVIQNQKADTNLSEIVEIIAERCIQQVLDETT